MIKWMCNSVTKMFLMYPNVAYVVWDCKCMNEPQGYPMPTTSMVRKGGTRESKPGGG